MAGFSRDVGKRIAGSACALLILLPGCGAKTGLEEPDGGESTWESEWPECRTPPDFGLSCSGYDCTTGVCWQQELRFGTCALHGCTKPCTSDWACQCSAREAGAEDPDRARCVDGECNLDHTGLGAIYVCS